MIDPFDLPGPEFLVFYAGLAGLIAVAIHLALRFGEGGQPPTLPLSNPYEIAWLRGGDAEAIRLALHGLIDRGAIERRDTGELVRSESPPDGFTPQQPIEQALLERCAAPVRGALLLRDPGVKDACRAYRARLETLALVPDATARMRRWLWFLLGAVVLIGAALIKTEIALDRGRHNLALLFFFTLGALWVAWMPVRRRRTHLGDLVLRDLRRLFEAQRGSAAALPQGGLTPDMLLVGAVFGLAVLPGGNLVQAYGAGAGGGSSCGSSSSCGGGGGSSCGGCGSSS